MSSAWNLPAIVRARSLVEADGMSRTGLARLAFVSQYYARSKGDRLPPGWGDENSVPDRLLFAPRKDAC